MIFDNINNSYLYETVNVRFKKAFEFLKNTDLLSLPSGKTEIEGSDIYAVVSEYQTKPNDNRYENHRKYIDIQYIVKGSEVMYFAQGSYEGTYDEVKDVSFCKIEKGSALNISQGSFAVFFPEEWHRPNCMDKEPQNMKKIVIKVKV